jgi:hypothetical protein
MVVAVAAAGIGIAVAAASKYAKSTNFRNNPNLYSPILYVRVIV